MLEIHADAVVDLRSILATDRIAATKLAALLEQLKCDPSLQAKLLDHGYGADGRAEINVSKWHSMYKVNRLPVWRLKFVDLERRGLPYRIIYINDWNRSIPTYVVLAVVPRGELDYDDPSHPIRLRVARRIRSDYRRI